jgi:hypothetical protein
MERHGFEPGSAGLGLAIAKENHGRTWSAFVDGQSGPRTSFIVELAVPAEGEFNGKARGRR